ncbi:MAG: 3-demethylubiquinone-9 3-O-methyltransferase [Planctomycetes bacterium]|nr:3-demethylubiquinone-9 3-O-methyltransferase [Planctomycetota bacterium]
MSEGPHDLFDREGWWDPACRAFASLRAVTTFRLQLLQRWLPGDWRGRVVVDLGCGGGLLAVPLARAGATVLGVDLARRALREGRACGAPGFLPLAGDLLRSPIGAGRADVVLLADVVEHVPEPALAVREAARLLRQGGRLFVNTIDRTARSRLLAITLAEGLGYVPRGTHDWRRFVRPQELDAMANAAGLRRLARAGEAPRLWRTLRSRTVTLRESRWITAGYAALYERVGA